MPISNARTLTPRLHVYLIDTNVISEARKADKANPGVISFFGEVAAQGQALYLSVISVGELRRGVELIRRRGDMPQAAVLETWLSEVLDQYRSNILPFDADAAQVWGRLRVPNAEHALDKQIAAIALVNGLTVVTRNAVDFAGTGVSVRNPFVPA
jgi:predicted nucleic acid-binding protein